MAFMQESATPSARFIKEMIFFSLPSHVGILVNEKADKAAKCALNKPIL